MFYDPNAETDITDRGNLPHWHQAGKIQFVTLRLADSLPLAVRNELKAKEEQFKQFHPLPWSPEIKKLYWKTIGPMEERLLENGYGSCVLKSKEVRDIVANAIMYKDTVNYNVIAFVIMPNHVHLLIQPSGPGTLSTILHSIKRFSSLQINKLLNRTGSLWMSESFDRIVRSAGQLKHYVEYIKENPRNLKPTDYTLYINGAEVS